jgi:hypothetical protein
MSQQTLPPTWMEDLGTADTSWIFDATVIVGIDRLGGMPLGR